MDIINYALETDRLLAFLTSPFAFSRSLSFFFFFFLFFSFFSPHTHFSAFLFFFAAQVCWRRSRGLDERSRRDGRQPHFSDAHSVFFLLLLLHLLLFFLLLLLLRLLAAVFFFVLLLLLFFAFLLFFFDRPPLFYRSLRRPQPHRSSAPLRRDVRFRTATNGR